MITTLKKLGPGLLFAGAAIGVSHLVQSTRAGADFGLGLLWALLLATLFKYPFFQYGTRYASATGESLLDGYKKLGTPILIIYYILSFATIFTIQTAVTIVTAGLATTLFGDFSSIVIGDTTISSIQIWTVIITIICLAIVLRGKYKLLDVLMKVIIITLSISTIGAVIVALTNTTEPLNFTQVFPKGTIEIGFLAAFMGWMPAPLDIAVAQSLWTVEKKKDTKSFNTKTALFDFNIGYISTIILGVCFVFLGYLIMYGSGETFSNSGASFSNQLIQMYTSSLGNWAYIIIGIAAFTTMFSTTLTTLDASPRTMHRSSQLLFKKEFSKGFLFWASILAIGTIIIFFAFASEMGLLVKIATILSFITAPFYATINYWLIRSKHMPQNAKPQRWLHLLSWAGIIFLTSFSIWYLTTL